MLLLPNQFTVKSSKVRLIVSGNEVEQIEYERPYFWNFPQKNSTASRFECNDAPASDILSVSDASGSLTLPGDALEEEERRDDHLRRTRSALRRLISANADAWDCMPIFLTYTFAENVQDITHANSIFTAFTRKLKKRIGIKLKYVVVMEFQKRGAIHYHAIYFNIPYIAGLRKIVAETWAQGFIKLESVRNVRNLGAYIAKYLQVDLDDKRLVGKKAYFSSRGLVKPYELRNQESIDNFLQTAIVTSDVQKVEYDSLKFGVINYKQYKIKKDL